MKKVLRVILSAILVLTLLVCFVGCSKKSESTDSPESTEPLGTVRYGIHQGGSAFEAGFLAKVLEIYKDYNIDIEMTVTTGPNVFAALSTGEMDIGVLGNGMAWHYFEDNSPIAILTIDNLTNDDRLIVRTGKGLTENASMESLYEKLPGMTLACDLTTTPGSFLKSLVNAINADKADSDKLWYEDVESAYPLKGSANKEIIIMNTTNANINAVMQDDKVDCCIAFGNIKTRLQNDTENYVVAATTFTHLSDTITPSTWAVNREFAENNPELVQAFVNALVDAMDYRSNESNWDDCIKLAMPFDQLEAEDYDPTIAYWPSRADLKNYFATPNSDGYKYIEQIRASHMGNNGLEDATAPKASEVILSQFIVEACK
jgi:NitT/TauT family transport system substrate-binding protein